MMRPSNSCLPRRLLLALATVLLAATGTASAQSCGTGGCAFWATEVNDSWFNPFRWGGILPWQGGVPNSSVSCQIELAVQVDVLGQGQAASCQHLQFNHVNAVVRVAGSSFRSELNVHGTQMDNNGLILIDGQDALQDSSLIIHNNTNANGANGRIHLSAPPANHGAFLSPANNLGSLLVNWPSHTIEGNGSIRVRLQNDGLIQLEGGALSAVFGGGGQAMVNSPGHTIGGFGTIALALTNRGELLADRNGLSSDPGQLTLQTSAQVNEGTMVARNGGTLSLQGITLTQDSLALARAEQDSAIVLEGAAAVVGGRLATSGNGVIFPNTSDARLENLTLASGANLTVPCSRLTLVGTINSSGTITLDNAGCGPNFAVLRGNGATALAQSGEVRLRADGPSGNVTLEGSGGLLTLGSGQALTGTGRISGRFRSVIFPPEYAGLDARIEVLADRVRLTIVAPLLTDGFEAP